MPVMQSIKENPWKVIFGSAGTITSIVVAMFTLDARYAHAADVEKDKTETTRSIERNTQILRKQMLEDKLFELDFKRAQAPDRKLTPLEDALRERYQRQLTEISKVTN